MRKYLKEVLYILGNDKNRIPWLIALFLGATIIDLIGLSLIGPFIAIIFDPNAMEGSIGQFFIALELPKGKRELLMLVGGTLFVVFFLKAVSGLWINYKIVKFSQVQQVRLRSHLMQVYQSMPYTEYLNRNSSEYVHTILTLVGQFTASVLMSGLRIMSDGMVAVTILMFLAWKNWQVLTMLVVFLSILLIGFDKLFAKKLKFYGEESNIGAISMVKGINEGLEGFKEIRVIGKEHYFYDRVKRASLKQTKMGAKSLIIASMPRYFLELGLISFIVTVIIISVLRGDEMHFIITTIGLFGVASLRLIPSANVLSGSFIQLRFAKNSVSRLYNDLKLLDSIELNTISQQKVNKERFKNISLHNVDYQYPKTENKVLDNISIRIDAGESIGLIGASGSGKTTLVDLLLGLLEPTSGTFKFNGKTWDKKKEHWGARVAYLPQQVFMIDDSLRNNIALGVSEYLINDNEINEAVRQSSLKELVECLPNGIHTIIGERGVRLSGGQRQRIALSRAFYHKKDVLVMDEATSALDNETELEIVEEIKRLKGKKTMIVIAHRLTTVQHCDRIYKLEKGKIVGSGIPQEMLNINVLS